LRRAHGAAAAAVKTEKSAQAASSAGGGLMSAPDSPPTQMDRRGAMHSRSRAWLLRRLVGAGVQRCGWSGGVCGVGRSLSASAAGRWRRRKGPKGMLAAVQINQSVSLPVARTDGSRATTVDG